MKKMGVTNNAFLREERLDRTYSMRRAIEALLGDGRSIEFINDIDDFETLSKLEDELTSEYLCL